MSLPQNVDQGKTNHSTDAVHAESTTTCGTITGEERSAIAVVAIRGPEANKMMLQCFKAATKRPFSAGEIRFGSWTGPHRGNTEGESVVLVPLGDDRFEIHCHGGPAAISRILDDLQAAGAKHVEDGWSLETGEELMVEEAMQVLSRCLTVKTAAIALDQLRGGLRGWAHNWLAAIENSSASVEALRESAREVMVAADFATRLTEPFRVVLWGPPNVGKSSLLNAIVGFDRSITLDEAGTTRDVLHAETVIDGLPIRLSDTAGIRESDESIEQQGIARAQVTASDADLVVCVTEPALALDPNTTTAAAQFASPTLRVLNKADLVPSESQSHTYDVATCAISGQGIEELMDCIVKLLQSGMPKSGGPAPINRRQASLVEAIATAQSSTRSTEQLRQLLYGSDRAAIQPPSA